MKGAIFDLDGTLLDSMRFWNKVVELYLGRKGKTLLKEDKQIIDSLTITKSSQFIKERFELKETVEEIEKEILDLIECNYKFNIPLKPYVHLFLNNLKKRNVKMCVASASHKYLVEYALERHNILDMFEFIITSDEVGDSKKDSPKIYEESIKRLGISKEDTVVFEDSYHAIKTLKEAGFITVGVYDNAFKEFNEEIKALSDTYIKNFNEYKL